MSDTFRPVLIVLQRGREHSLLRRHPWIFSGAISKIEGNPADGDWVTVMNSAGQVMGYGHYQKGSIAVRMLEFGEKHDDDVYQQKFSQAYSFRSLPGVIPSDTDCFRLIHGEGDGLPGLVVDIYGYTAVVQAHSFGMATDRARIGAAIMETSAGRIESIWFRDAASGSGEWLVGEHTGELLVREYGNIFEVDIRAGQKTGFFLDQRENRRLLGDWCRGRKVLNTFCYSGGFSVYALRHGAELVHSVDASSAAIDLCRRNLRHNGFDDALHTCTIADTFDYLQQAETRYDVIILDPPAFAKHKDARHQAMKGYQRLNAEAIRRIGEDGILFTFSCSQVVDRQLFYDTVMSAAIVAGRDARVLAHLSQPPDHPVSVFHPEGSYLKGLVLHIR